MSSQTGRISVPDLGFIIARAMAGRSEDPWTKVGAVGFTVDNRIVATAYNGLLPGFEFPKLREHVLNNSVSAALLDGDRTVRDFRLPFMVHAEQNLCSLVDRNVLHWVCVTHRPCSSCLLLLATHGVRKILYLEEYGRDPVAEDVAEFYNLELTKYGETH